MSKEIKEIMGYCVKCSCCDDVGMAIDGEKEFFVVYRNKKDALKDSVEAGTNQIKPVVLLYTFKDEK